MSFAPNVNTRSNQNGNSVPVAAPICQKNPKPRMKPQGKKVNERKMKKGPQITQITLINTIKIKKICVNLCNLWTNKKGAEI
jgi:hypothetical protein